MTSIHAYVGRLRADASGQDLLEYAMLVALIVIVAIGGVTTLGNVIREVFWDAIAASSV